ncbi:uncharacterized protein [Linepithema humile]|uniref:uncharacterized protein n=1 Tax=Linepithema humile TaxID=83485 RepID=UPI00351ED6D9
MSPQFLKSRAFYAFIILVGPTNTDNAKDTHNPVRSVQLTLTPWFNRGWTFKLKNNNKIFNKNNLGSLIYTGKSRSDSEGLHKYWNQDDDQYNRRHYDKRHTSDRYDYNNYSDYSPERSPSRDRYSKRNCDRSRSHNQSCVQNNSSSADRSSNASDVSKPSHRSQGSDDGEKSIGLSLSTATPTSTSQSSAAVPIPPTASAVEEKELNPDILQVIGLRVHPDRKFAPAVHTQVATGVGEIINKGLPAEKRNNLLEKFLSQNCLMLDPPKLNPELKATLQESIIKRDSRIMEKQNRITASLAGILEVITKITNLKKDENLPTREVMESLWGILHLLADLQREESNIRRSLVLMNINTSLKEALTATVVDEWLFGEKLDDKVKAAKTLETSSKILKPCTQQTQKNKKQSKNFRGPLRRQSAYGPT